MRSCVRATVGAILRVVYWKRSPLGQKFWFEISGIQCDEWNGISSPSQAITFKVSRENTNSKTRENITCKMEDSVLLLLELFDDSEVEFFFFSVASCYMRRNLNECTSSKYNTTVFSRRIQESFSNDERKLTRSCQQEEYHSVTDLGELRSHLQNNLYAFLRSMAIIKSPLEQWQLGSILH